MRRGELNRNREATGGSTTTATATTTFRSTTRTTTRSTTRSTARATTTVRAAGRAREFRRRGAAGFTLIEIVIALGISVLIFSVMYGSLRQMMRTKALLDDERDLGAVANAVIDRLTRELQLTTYQQKLMPQRGDLQHKYADDVHMIGKHETLSNGESGDSLVFMANEGGQYVHNGVTHSGLVQIGYRAAPDPESPDDEGYYLVRDETPFSPNYDTAYEKLMTFPVTRSLAGLEFAYYDGKSWHNEWSEEQHKLPRLVKFTVKLRSPAGIVHTFSTMVPIEGQGTAANNPSY